jgi:pilus assembly protein Flp/PilA
MRKFARSAARWLSVDSEEGVTAVEYGLIAALVAVAIIASLTYFGNSLGDMFRYIGNKVQSR